MKSELCRGEKKGRWHIKRDLYDWWLRKITERGFCGGMDPPALCVLRPMALSAIYRKMRYYRRFFPIAVP